MRSNKPAAVALELTGANISTGELKTFYFATTGFTTKPSDTPPNTHFEGRLYETPSLGRTIFESGAIYGAIEPQIGDAELINNDGELDYLMTEYAFDGRGFVVKTGETGTSYSTWDVIMSGKLRGAKADVESLRMIIQDRLIELDKWDRPVYLGNNVAPNGVEGTADDLKDKTKPRVYGRVMNIQPILVNAPKLIYQASDKANCTIQAVYDEGLALTKGADYASLADLQATSPASGSFRAFQGYFRLGGNPAGVITCDATSSETRVTQLLREIAIDGGIDPSDISTDALTNTAPVGIYSPEDTTARELMSALASSVGAWFGFDRFGMLRMGVVTTPSGTPVKEWDASEYSELDVADFINPVWKVTLQYALNYTVQNRLATSVSITPRAAWLSQQYRTVKSESQAIRDLYTNQNDLEFPTLLVQEADAQAEVARLADFYSVRRILATFVIPLSELGDVDLSDVVRIQSNRYGIQDRLVVVTGLNTGYTKDSAQLSVLG